MDLPTTQTLQRPFRGDRTALQERADELVQQGMPRAEAVVQARREFGNVTRTAERGRETWQWPAVESLAFDVRYALRQLRMQPVFATVSVLILGLGIGASTTVFSVVKRLALEPLPVRAADRLVSVINTDLPALSAQTSTVATFEALQTMRSFEELTTYEAFFARASYKLTGDGEPERLAGVLVGDNFFSFLGVEPAAGRSFTADEGRKNGPGAVMLSHELWKRRYKSDRAVIGRQLRINDRAATIVGVLPPTFDFGEIFAPGVKIDLYMPAILEDMRNWGNALAIVGRLRTGTPFNAAQAEANLTSARLQREHPDRGDPGSYGAILKHLGTTLTGNLRRPMMVLWAAVGLVLLIVCVNLSSLLLARAASRRKEMAVRGALGAGKTRLVRQMLTETCVLALFGGGLGVAFAYAAVEYVRRFEGLSIPLLKTAYIDGTALATAAGITLLTALLFGLAPAFAAARHDLATAMKNDSRSATEGRDHRVTRSALVVSEVALACLLLVGAGLLLRRFVHVLDINLGLQPHGTYTLRVDPGAAIDTGDKSRAYLRTLITTARATPGVEAASVTDALPLESNRSWFLWAKEKSPKEGTDALVKLVGPRLLETMRTPLLAGREFNEQDDHNGAPVALINENLARRLWPNSDPLNGVVRCANVDWKVVGVVRDVRHLKVEESAGPELYLPVYARRATRSLYLVVRTNKLFSDVGPALRRALSDVAPDLPTAGFRPVADVVSRALSQRRFFVDLLTAFATIALLLAAIGIYGLISYSVTRRTAEIGIRMALGASGSQIFRAVVRDTLRLALAGVFLGIVAAVALSSLLASLLFNVSANDTGTYVFAAGLLLLVALAAAFFPAFRAGRISPMNALRAE
ncbi:MAG TPA: ABC transporter permease [Bryobacteraceae bacterium]|nr:ABC transporter permease [Bryobacteraceae bacterium]